MERFAGDGGAPSTEMAFPDHVAPFPEAVELIYAHPTAAIHSPAELIGHGQSLPPKKLRPIRCCSGRYPEALSGTLGSCSTEEEEVGFLDGARSEYFEAPGKDGAGEAVKGGGFGGGLVGDDPDRVSSGPGAGEWGPSCEDKAEESSSSSDDENGDDDSTANIREPMNRKRKRKSRRKLELFLENLVSKVMERQEQMHKQMIEIIEKRERERIIREEAWKQQEMQRIKREEEMRAQETSRSLALISFIQNLLCHEIQILEPVTTQCKGGDGGNIGMQNDIQCNPNNRKWEEAEVQALITLRSALEHNSPLTGSKQSIWEEISVGLHNMGYNRTALMCKQKWVGINRNFRGKKHPTDGKICQYFHELNMLYRNGHIDPGFLGKATNSEIEAKSEKK